jgi:hypothetical protein
MDNLLSPNKARQVSYSRTVLRLGVACLFIGGWLQLHAWGLGLDNFLLLNLLLGLGATLLGGYRMGWLVAPVYWWVMTLVHLGQQFIISGHWYSWNPIWFVASQGIEGLILTAVFAFVACLGGLIVALAGYLLSLRPYAFIPIRSKIRQSGLS